RNLAIAARFPTLRGNDEPQDIRFVPDRADAAPGSSSKSQRSRPRDSFSSREPAPPSCLHQNMTSRACARRVAMLGPLASSQARDNSETQGNLGPVASQCSTALRELLRRGYLQ